MTHKDFESVRGIIFDYGGTLDTGGDHWSEVIWSAWQSAGIACDKAEFREAYVFGERELARTRHILPEHDFADLLLIKMRIELQWLASRDLFAPALVEEKAKLAADYCCEAARQRTAGAKKVLLKLRERYPLVLVSNFYGNINTVLTGFGLTGIFSKVIESAVVGVRKPDPEIFRLGCEALGLPPQQVVVIGDSLRKDIEPAEKLGCRVLWLKGKGWTAEEDAAFHPAAIRSLDEALELLIG